MLASGRNVNILVLDTEVYSNTGGQMSKATPRGAVAKFAAGGKPAGKKDLAMMAMTYGNVYVAQVAMGANDTQTVKAFLEAEAYDGPSHHHRLQPLHRPRLRHEARPGAAEAGGADRPLAAVPLQPGAGQRQGKNPFQLDSKAPTLPLEKYIYNETRYTMLIHSKPEAATPAAGRGPGRRHAPLAAVRADGQPCRAGVEAEDTEGERRRP